VNQRQHRMLELLSQNPNRDVYEAGDPKTNMKTGNGEFYCTHSGGERYEPLTLSDVQQLLDMGYLAFKWKPTLNYFRATDKVCKVTRGPR
jgi:hypothetical protein